MDSASGIESVTKQALFASPPPLPCHPSQHEVFCWGVLRFVLARWPVVENPGGQEEERKRERRAPPHCGDPVAPERAIRSASSLLALAGILHDRGMHRRSEMTTRPEKSKKIRPVAHRPADSDNCSPVRRNERAPPT
ncbi:hypothetical protein HPB50_000278 [Hyalomma asiaticum]|uniref:Uncharacterized protein n=1 Tax=Hyalomma asiaticum TaxID=266040 RepID=A0ACB7S3D9_HYAAI|nr:hypothetical protein HPB50_000278 [Hyalomma asiaticum]